MDIAEEHKNVILSIDMLFVNIIPFLICHGALVNHICAYRWRNRNKKSIAKKLNTVINKYYGRGFQVKVVFADN